MAKQKKGGAKPMTETHTMQTRLSLELLAELDEWRRRRPELPTRTDAIRLILKERIEADARPKRRRP